MSGRVLVIGAGPVGLTNALLLAEAGVAVTVVEKSTVPGDLPRAISIVDETFRVMELLGLADELKSHSLTDTGSRYYGLNDRLLTAAKPVPSRTGHPAKTQFDQPVMEELLFNQAQQHVGVDFRTGCSATALSQDANGVKVEITNEAGEVEIITGAWLVGADGGRSFVRDALGIKLGGTTQAQRWIVIDLLNETRKYEKYADFHCNGERPYVLVPGVEGRLRIEFMLFDHEDADAMTTPEMIRTLVQPIRDPLDPADVRRATVYVAHQRIAERYRKDRAFLIGDAAHLMPPFAGQGLNAGIRDAQNLAWKLIEASKGGASERLLDSYELERRTHGAKMVKISHRIGAVVMATGKTAPRLRDAVVRAVSVVPYVYNFLANMKFITPPNYAAGVAVSPSPSLPKNLRKMVGAAVSQPRVIDVNGQEVGLDFFLGHNWGIISVGGSAKKLNALDEYWDRIDARHIRLLSQVERAEPAADSVELVDIDSVLVHSDETPFYLLVRPDKYVAAVFRQEDEQQVITQMRAFIDDRSRPWSGSVHG